MVFFFNVNICNSFFNSLFLNMVCVISSIVVFVFLFNRKLKRLYLITLYRSLFNLLYFYINLVRGSKRVIVPMANQTTFSPTGMFFSSHMNNTSGSLVPRPQATPFMPAVSVGSGNPPGFSPFFGPGYLSPPAACLNSPLQSDPAVSSLELGPLAPLQAGPNGLNFAGAPLVADPLNDPRIANKQLAFQALSNGGHLILCRLFVGALPNNVCLSHKSFSSLYSKGLLCASLGV